MKLIKALQNGSIPMSQINLVFQSRTIWRDLATWIRAYLVSRIGGIGDEETINQKINELLKKAVNIFSIVFGDQLAAEFFNLLSNFKRIFDSLIDAEIKGDKDAVNEYINQLNRNTDELAAFLSKVNPYWLENKWKGLFNQLNQKTIEEAVTFINKDYKKNVDVFDSILDITSIIGDYYSEGILNYLNYYSVR